VTSSDHAKLTVAKEFGAHFGISYKRTQQWEKELMRITSGHGVDCVIEVGGAGTLY
jgi:NADPH:quinone reductase-like Zn-dependent oxidoreductase